MYIRLTSEGVVKEVSSNLLEVLRKTQLQVIGRSFVILFKNKRDILPLGARFLKINTVQGDSEKVHKYFIGGSYVWIKWNFTVSDNQDIILIGKDVSCKLKFKPIIERQNKILRQQNKNMIASLSYAKYIQNALLPSPQILNSFRGSFIIYHPKDIVSGDFYWFYESNNVIVVISIDCTGHGVPGALMTVLVNSLLNEIIKIKQIQYPHEILELLDKNLQQSLHTSTHKLNDGLDTSICAIDLKTGTLKFSGAQQNLIVVSKEEVRKIKGGKFPIGYFPHKQKLMETLEIKLEEGDKFYLHSDGFIDQFGGEKSKKFGTKKFLSVLASIRNMNMDEQKQVLEDTIKTWRGQEEQIDDILILGFEY
ncbi:MAG: SpoIIE family protein phosphatase [Crocinitomicaceae bacterium]|nr:SpoIIE family protein phosphatase [Crocinitomicaceae bacterium]